MEKSVYYEDAKESEEFAALRHSAVFPPAPVSLCGGQRKPGGYCNDYKGRIV